MILIIKIYESSSEDIDDGLVIDTAFYSIQTHGGDLDLELRTEHDGYYSGRIKFLSEIPHEDNSAK